MKISGLNLFFLCEFCFDIVANLAVSVSVCELFLIPVEKLIRSAREVLHQAAYVSSYSAGSVRFHITELEAVSVFRNDTILRIIFRVDLILCSVASVFRCLRINNIFRDECAVRHIHPRTDYITIISDFYPYFRFLFLIFSLSHSSAEPICPNSNNIRFF